MMVESGSGDPGRRAAGLDSDEAAYQDGYQRMLRAATWGRERGFVPTQRQLTVALMRTMRVYAAVRGGKVIAGQRPEWLRGQAEALRELLRQGIGAQPDGA
jgi:hypothetical protein